MFKYESTGKPLQLYKTSGGFTCKNPPLKHFCGIFKQEKKVEMLQETDKINIAQYIREEEKRTEQKDLGSSTLMDTPKLLHTEQPSLRMTYRLEEKIFTSKSKKEKSTLKQRGGQLQSG